MNGLPSPLGGEGQGEGESSCNHPHLNPPPSKGEEVFSRIWMPRSSAAGQFTFITPGLIQAEPIRWQSYQEGLKRAKAENKKVFLNFHADW